MHDALLAFCAAARAGSNIKMSGSGLAVIELASAALTLEIVQPAAPATPPVQPKRQCNAEQ
jgi:hypothetical protein